MTRLSTGYTFLNIQDHSKYLRENINNIDKIRRYEIKKKYQFLDKIFLRVLSIKPSPPITIIRLGFIDLLFFKFFKINDLIFSDFLFVSEIIFILIILLVPSARLELALPKGQGF